MVSVCQLCNPEGNRKFEERNKKNPSPSDLLCLSAFQEKRWRVKGKIAFRFYFFYAINIFLKFHHQYFIEIPLQTFSIIRKQENRMPSSCSCFAKTVKCLRKGTIAPKQGHLCALVRAQRCTSQTPPVNPKHRFLSIRDTSCKQVICT